jgi:hypothetical protein
MRTSTNEWRKSDKVDFLNGKVKREVLDSLDSIYAKTPTPYFFFNNGDELMSYVSCGFDLYSINGTSLDLKYLYLNRGYTCGTTPFVRDSSTYLIGGYGFWNLHFDLLKFDEINGSWDLIKTTNQPMNYHSNGLFQNSKGIYSLFGKYENERIGLKEAEPNGYFLDWETKEWKRIEIQIEGVNNAELEDNSSLAFIQTEDYVFMMSGLPIENFGWNILEKETGKIYQYDYLRNLDMFTSPFTEVIGNTIQYQSPDGTSKSLDLAYLLSQSKEVGFIQVLEKGFLDSFSLKNNPFISIATLTLVGIIILSFLWTKRTKKQAVSALGFDEIEKLIENFKPHSGQLLDSEKLDSLLGIDSNGNADLARVKRSRMIIRVNKYYTSQKGKELIVREKNPKDKRYVYYKVDI